ncbi:MAG: nucleotidyl transferase AbiEii/AbiGii toxin family protein [Candidatus Taylorbacteria bacterium]|nr:nucleotidyl transferase AbiEii/AbiGii toxin family protein [Candidatus Taylorbacteria bacterium]
MEASSQEQLDFNWGVVPKQTKKALDFLSEQQWLAEGGWYLAGGTALALQTGHRTSVDLDFFTTAGAFESTEVTGHFKDVKDWDVTNDRPSTIYGNLFKAKVSFIAYPFFYPKEKYVMYGTVKILKPLDIAVMKIIAVSQRGRKRDFFDLYWCAHHLEPLEKTLERLREQYPSVAHDFHHIIKSMAYFEDAENDPPLTLHFDASWEKVKDFFRLEVERLAYRYI